MRQRASDRQKMSRDPDHADGARAPEEPGEFGTPADEASPGDIAGEGSGWPGPAVASEGAGQPVLLEGATPASGSDRLSKWGLFAAGTAYAGLLAQLFLSWREGPRGPVYGFSLSLSAVTQPPGTNEFPWVGLGLLAIGLVGLLGAFSRHGRFFTALAGVAVSALTTTVVIYSVGAASDVFGDKNVGPGRALGTAPVAAYAAAFLFVFAAALQPRSREEPPGEGLPNPQAPPAEVHRPQAEPWPQLPPRGPSPDPSPSPPWPSAPAGSPGQSGF